MRTRAPSPRTLAALAGAAATVIAALAPSPAAHAVDFRMPCGNSDCGYFYPTSYYDHGGSDWNCGGNTYSGHRGSDWGVGGFAGMAAGRDLVAAASGVVIATNDGEFDECTTGNCAGGGGYGNYVKIEHNDGKTTIYAHMRIWTVAVSSGQTVACGQHLGQVGSSGYSTGPHIHFEVRESNNSQTDPFDGPCSSPPDYWVGAGPYGGIPDTTCDGGGQGPVDADGDGWTVAAGDCDDGHDDTYPGAPEQADHIDNDCDGLVDEGTDAADDDGDGWSELDGDCDDTHPDTHPGAPEYADHVDNDCDGTVDEHTDVFDDDGDGYTELDGDCDDTDPTMHPGAPEQPDHIDNDCDGQVDEDTLVHDDDGDGYTELDGDCDDANGHVHPGHDEFADGLDNDCDGLIDEDLDDGDDDGDGYSEADGDCDDRDPAVHPGAVEVEDGIDNDCDGHVDFPPGDDDDAAGDDDDTAGDDDTTAGGPDDDDTTGPPAGGDDWEPSDGPLEMGCACGVAAGAATGGRALTTPRGPPPSSPWIALVCLAGLLIRRRARAVRVGRSPRPQAPPRA